MLLFLSFFFDFYSFIFFNLFFILFFFNLWWILSYIEMKQPWVLFLSYSSSIHPSSEEGIEVKWECVQN